MKNTKIISKHLRLPSSIITTLEEEAGEYGYKFNDWVKIILTNRVIEIRGKEESNHLTKEEILQGIKESKSGKIPQLKSKKDIAEFLDGVYNE
jgi:hypothetical protein